MVRSTYFLGGRLYSVEISGWDHTQNFFVERCELVWNEESGKHVALRRELADNALLFVRLLQPGEAERSYPVVYKVQVVGKTQSGLHQIRLNTVAPLVSELESSLA